MACPLPYIPLLSLLLLLPLLIALTEASSSSSSCQLSLSPGTACGKGRFCFGHEKEERLREETTREFELTALNCKGKSLRLTNKKPHIGLLSTTDAEQEADDLGKEAGLQLELPSNSANTTVVFNVTGTFLGFTSIEIVLEEEEASLMLDLTVTRSKA